MNVHMMTKVSMTCTVCCVVQNCMHFTRVCKGKMFWFVFALFIFLHNSLCGFRAGFNFEKIIIFLRSPEHIFVNVLFSWCV